MGIHKGDSLHEGGSLYIGDSLYETAEESVFPSLWRSLWRGRLVLVVGVGPKCFLIPGPWCGLVVWGAGFLVRAVGIGCWCGFQVFS